MSVNFLNFAKLSLRSFETYHFQTQQFHSFLSMSKVEKTVKGSIELFNEFILRQLPKVRPGQLKNV